MVCPWAAARPRAVRAASFARRVASKPGQAPTPPTGTASRSRPRALRLGVAVELARWFETAIAFACSCSCGIETPVAFAGAGRASTETVIAFAGAKWVFLVQFSGAEVMPVSEVPCWGRAVVLLVSASPRCRALCVKKFALRYCAGLGCSAAHLRLDAVGGLHYMNLSDGVSPACRSLM